MNEIASPVPLEDEMWRRERLDAYLHICSSVQKLHELLRKTETAIQAKHDDLSDGRMAKEIIAYNAAHPSHEEKNFDGITDVKVAMAGFDTSKERAAEVYKMLWCKGSGVEVFELQGIDEFKEARGLAKKVEDEVEAWGKRASRIAGMASAVAA